MKAFEDRREVWIESKTGKAIPMRDSKATIRYTSWRRVEEQPPKGIPVETKISDERGDRHHVVLILHGNLWFHEDMRSYVYYTPTHWRFT